MKPTGNPHSMPIPSNTPWKSESMPWSMTSAMQQNSVMQFTAPFALDQQFSNSPKNNQHKRKSKIVPPLPSKQFITEEKVIAHFNGMHISSQYTQHNAGGTSNESTMEYDFNNPITQKELEEKLKNANRITICEEVKKLHAVHSSFMPNALINRIERPCTALVLWTPPPKLEDLLPEARNVSNNNSIDFDTTENEEDNNNSTNSNMNILDIENDGMDTDL